MQRPGLGDDPARDLMVAPSRLPFTMPSFCLSFDLPCCPAADNVHAVLGKLFETSEVKQVSCCVLSFQSSLADEEASQIEASFLTLSWCIFGEAGRAVVAVCSCIS